VGYVYLVHLERPLPGGRRHYVGYARDKDHLEERRLKHRAGTGAQILKEANEAGISWLVVRVWMNATSDKERQIKSMAAKFICPVCKAKDAELARQKKLLRQVSRARLSVSDSVEVS
jgi:predicted GIY-YIG superfamily endonuclease